MMFQKVPKLIGKKNVPKEICPLEKQMERIIWRTKATPIT
jgi:hypothetical protein